MSHLYVLNIVFILTSFLTLLSSSSPFNIPLASQIAHQHFSNCSTIFFTTSISFEDVSYFLLKSRSRNNPTNYVINPSITKQFTGRFDLRRFTSFCKLIITLLPGEIQSFPVSSFVNLLTPLKDPITKRNRDHYVFLLKNSTSSNALFEEVNYILTHEDISHELKFKIVITNKPYKNVYTNCMYCENGRQKVISLYPESGDNTIKLFPDFTQNMNGNCLRIVGPTSYASVFELTRIPPNNEYRMKRGLYTDIFHIIQTRLNFTYTFHPCYGFGDIKEGKTGTLLENGTWIGCVGDLIRRRGDFAIATSAVDLDRFEVVEYLTPICYNYIMFFTQKPRLAYTWRTIFRVFDIYTWLLVIGITLVVSTFFYLLEQDYKSITFLLLHFYGNMLGQPMSTGKPHSVPSQITYAIWLFYAIVVGTAYSGILKALLAFPGTVRIPRTIAGLVENAPNWGWGASSDFRSGIGEEVFKRSSNPMVRRIFNGLQRDATVEECLQRAAVSNYACFHWDIMAKFTMRTEFVARRGIHYPFISAHDNVMFLPRTWSTRKHEIFQNGINYVSAACYDSGLWIGMMKLDATEVRKEMLDAVDRRERKPLFGTKLLDNSNIAFDDSKSARPLRFEQVKAGFIALTSGVFISGLILVAENVVNYYYKQK